VTYTRVVSTRHYHHLSLCVTGHSSSWFLSHLCSKNFQQCRDVLGTIDAEDALE